MIMLDTPCQCIEELVKKWLVFSEISIDFIVSKLVGFILLLMLACLVVIIVWTFIIDCFFGLIANILLRFFFFFFNFIWYKFHNFHLIPVTYICFARFYPILSWLCYVHYFVIENYRRIKSICHEFLNLQWVND